MGGQYAPESLNNSQQSIITCLIYLPIQKIWGTVYERFRLSGYKKGTKKFRLRNWLFTHWLIEFYEKSLIFIANFPSESFEGRFRRCQNVLNVLIILHIIAVIVRWNIFSSFSPTKLHFESLLPVLILI